MSMFGCFGFGKIGGQEGRILVYLIKENAVIYVRRTQTQNQRFCGKISSISK